MKKISLFGRSILTIVLRAIFATTTMAQTNPKPGYIITNNGDTIRGNIDFRTNEKLLKQCEFWANGGNEDTTYKPGDIEGFRFDNGGKYFCHTPTQCYRRARIVLCRVYGSRKDEPVLRRIQS